MTEGTDLHFARLNTFNLACERREEYRSLMWFAHARDDTQWLWQEYQTFFLNGIYTEATGSKSCSYPEIVALVVTADGAKWIEENCLNPFWFWSVLYFGCHYATELPLTRENLEDAASVCFQEACDDMTTTQVVGSPEGYSGPQVPWHVWDLFVRGHIWNDRSSLETGLNRGLLMMQQAGRAAKVIYNPLLGKLSSIEPASVNFKEQQ